jgi:hypothetical protein
MPWLKDFRCSSTKHLKTAAAGADRKPKIAEQNECSAILDYCF